MLSLFIYLFNCKQHLQTIKPMQKKKGEMGCLTSIQGLTIFRTGSKSAASFGLSFHFTLNPTAQALKLILVGGSRSSLNTLSKFRIRWLGNLFIFITSWSDNPNVCLLLNLCDASSMQRYCNWRHIKRKKIRHAFFLREISMRLRIYSASQMFVNQIAHLI